MRALIAENGEKTCMLMILDRGEMDAIGKGNLAMLMPGFDSKSVPIDMKNTMIMLVPEEKADKVIATLQKDPGAVYKFGEEMRDLAFMEEDGVASFNC